MKCSHDKLVKIGENELGHWYDCIKCKSTFLKNPKIKGK